MTDKELHQLSRKDLLNLLVLLREENEQLTKDNAAKEAELVKYREQLTTLKRQLSIRTEHFESLEKRLDEMDANMLLITDRLGVSKKKSAENIKKNPLEFLNFGKKADKTKK